MVKWTASASSESCTIAAQPKLTDAVHSTRRINQPATSLVDPTWRLARPCVHRVMMTRYTQGLEAILGMTCCHAAQSSPILEQLS